MCAHNVLLANARAYHLYRDNYYEQQRGKVGMSLHTTMSMPKDVTKPEDVAAAERSLQFWVITPSIPILVVKNLRGDFLIHLISI